MKNSLVKISGGLAVMFSMFLLLATAKQFVNQETASTKIYDAPVEMTEVKNTPELEEVVLRGTFNIDTPGNIVRSYDQEGKVFYHYKAIPSPRLKKEEVSPVLKLEVNSDGQTAWKETPWSWIDYNQGTLYFHFKTVGDGSEDLSRKFTGRYQLIFE